MARLRNPRHEKFAQALAEGKSAAAAYRAAGFKANRANAAALRHQEHISERVDELVAQRQQREEKANDKALATAEVTAAKIIGELACAAFSDIGDILDFTGTEPSAFRLRRPCDIPERARRAIASVKVKRYVEGGGEDAREVELVEFKLWDKGSALEKLGRHFGLFVVQHQVTFEQLDRILEQATDLLRERLPADQAKAAVIELVRLAKDTYGQDKSKGRAA